MKKIWLALILIVLSLSGCRSLERNREIKVNLIGDMTPEDRLTVLLFAYDERVADKKADLMGKEEIVLKKEGNTVIFEIPKKKDAEIYYISLENSKDYMIDYSSGTVQKLEPAKENEVRINRK